MRLIFLGTVFLLFFGLGVRTEGSFNLTEEERIRNPALWQIRQAKATVENSLNQLPGADVYKKAMDSKLDTMKKAIDENGELTNGGNSGKIKSIGDAAIATATLFKRAVNGEFAGEQGGKEMANALISLTETFFNIGGAFAPPPFGQAISTGFGILNTFMSLAGLTPKVPSQREIMQELLDEQTREIRGMIDEVLDKFWEEIIDDSQAVLAQLDVPLDLLNRWININVECGTISEIAGRMKMADAEMTGHLSKLKIKMNQHCAGKKTDTNDAKNFMTTRDENKCLILLENYSEIYKMFIDMNEKAIEIFNKHEKKDRLMCGRGKREIRLESNRNACYHLSGKVCVYHFRIEDETKKLRKILNLFLKGIIKHNRRLPPKTSTTCLKTKVLTPGKFIFTKHALTAAGVNLDLTKNEESGKDIVCPSSKTKLMLVGGDNAVQYRALQIVSPFKKCEREISYKPNSKKHFRPGAAFYRTRKGDERVMVCGGQDIFSDIWKNRHQDECYSINSEPGSKWKKEADLPIGVAKPSMAFDSANMHVFGGYTKYELSKYNLQVDYNGGAYGERKPKDEPTYTAAREQVWQMDFTKGKYAWKVTEPPHNSVDYNRRYRSLIGAKCTVFHDGQFYSQGLKWIKNEISGPAQYTNKKSYHNIAGGQQTTYSVPTTGCLWGLSKETINRVYSISACQYKCDQRSWCRSVRYTPNAHQCGLSKYTKKSASDYWNQGCYNWANPNYYTSSKYSEKIIHDPVSTVEIWNDLPEYPNDLIHSCTVGVIFGQTSFVTDGPKGVYYFPIPYTPETNPQWQELSPQPPRDCKAGLGWADGRLMCVPKWSRKLWYTKDFYYFDEHNNAWIKRTLKRYTYALDAYDTVSAAFDKNMCEK